LLLIQGVSEIIKRAAIMKGLLPDPNAHALSAHEIAEMEALKLAQAIKTETP
jgi:TRAP-type mannitol/chloroaromatic compound transport system permease small subunit